ncbi:molybdopterin-dependent oxidoreductase [Klebsiella pneumoniae]|uniref:molybdopterin-dependent oxidoreductase n=1 Tax=Klebsiella pneumoniae TaxID=573 RepID=UPI003A91E905
MARTASPGFSPIPAMSMVSYAAGTRYLSLIGGTCLSFYDWYCDLPPASPMTWGETDRRAGIRPTGTTPANIIAWGSNVPQTRTPGRPLSLPKCATRAPKTIAITPDYSEVAKLCDQWLAPKQGTDMRAGDGHGPCDPQRPSTSINRAITFSTTCRTYHRHADAGDTRAARRRQLYARAVCCVLPTCLTVFGESN